MVLRAMKDWLDLQFDKVYAKVFGYDIFLSHAKVDAGEYAFSLQESLKANFDCFIDVHDFEPGNWRSQLEPIIKNSNHFILVCSEHAFYRSAVLYELLMFQKTQPSAKIDLLIFHKHNVEVPITGHCWYCWVQGNDQKGYGEFRDKLEELGEVFKEQFEARLSEVERDSKYSPAQLYLPEENSSPVQIKTKELFAPKPVPTAFKDREDITVHKAPSKELLEQIKRRYGKSKVRRRRTRIIRAVVLIFIALIIYFPAKNHYQECIHDINYLIGQSKVNFETPQSQMAYALEALARRQRIEPLVEKILGLDPDDAESAEANLRRVLFSYARREPRTDWQQGEDKVRLEAISKSLEEKGEETNPYCSVCPLPGSRFAAVYIEAKGKRVGLDFLKRDPPSSWSVEEEFASVPLLPFRTDEDPLKIRALSVSIDKNELHLLVGCDDNRAYLYAFSGVPSRDTWEAMRTWPNPRIFAGHEGPVYSVASQNNNPYIATGSDAEIRVWGKKSYSSLEVIRQHDYGVTSLEFTKDGDLLSVGDDETLRYWELALGQHQESISQRKQEGTWCWNLGDSEIWDISLAPDGKVLIPLTEHEAWEIGPGEGSRPIRVWHGADNKITAIRQSSSGKYIIGVEDYNRKSVEDKEIEIRYGVKSLALLEPAGLLVLGKEQADEQRLPLGTESLDEGADLVDTARFLVEHEEFRPRKELSERKHQWLKFIEEESTGKNWLGLSLNGPNIWLWDCDATRVVSRLSYPEDTDVNFRAFGRTCLSDSSYIVGGADDGRLYRWALPLKTREQNSAEVLTPRKILPGRISALAFSEDGEFWAVSDDSGHLILGKKTELEDAEHSSEGLHSFQVLRGNGIYALCFSADGKKLWIGDMNGWVYCLPTDIDECAKLLRRAVKIEKPIPGEFKKWDNPKWK